MKNIRQKRNKGKWKLLEQMRAKKRRKNIDKKANELANAIYRFA